MRGIKHTNSYSRHLGRAYEETPKAVWAALAWSLAFRLSDESSAAARSLLLSEWSTLHVNQIVPQAPPQRLE